VTATAQLLWEHHKLVERHFQRSEVGERPDARREGLEGIIAGAQIRQLLQVADPRQVPQLVAVEIEAREIGEGKDDVRQRVCEVVPVECVCACHIFVRTCLRFAQDTVQNVFAYSLESSVYARCFMFKVEGWGFRVQDSGFWV
jgi:hypothetical protein